jgi:hypothetical protein
MEQFHRNNRMDQEFNIIKKFFTKWNSQK